MSETMDEMEVRAKYIVDLANDFEEHIGKAASRWADVLVEKDAKLTGYEAVVVGLVELRRLIALNSGTLTEFDADDIIDYLDTKVLD